MDAPVFPADHILAECPKPRGASPWELENLAGDLISQGWVPIGVSEADVHGDQDILLTYTRAKDLMWFPLKWTSDAEQQMAVIINTHVTNIGTRVNDVFDAHTAGTKESVRVVPMSLEDEDIFEAIEILDETDDHYHIRWAPTYRIWENTWELKTNGVSAELLADWEAKKVDKKETNRLADILISAAEDGFYDESDAEYMDESANDSADAEE